MRRHGTPLLLFALVIFTSAPARAQERGQVGIAMAYPTSLELLWHPSEDVALRPEFTFNRVSTDLTSSMGTMTTSTSFGWTFGLSALIYVGRWEALRTYISPRFAYGRTTSSNSNFSSWTFTTSGSFGAQYGLNRRFGVFGETGLTFADTRMSGNTFSPGGHSWTTRTAAGVIVYFR